MLASVIQKLFTICMASMGKSRFSTKDTIIPSSCVLPVTCRLSSRWTGSRNQCDSVQLCKHYEYESWYHTQQLPTGTRALFSMPLMSKLFPKIIPANFTSLVTTRREVGINLHMPLSIAMVVAIHQQGDCHTSVMNHLPVDCKQIVELWLCFQTT